MNESSSEIEAEMTCNVGPVDYSKFENKGRYKRMGANADSNDFKRTK
jgi:hypothetical protein